MDIQNRLLNILRQLPQNQQERLRALETEDRELFKDTLLEILRLSIIQKSGNIKAWEKWKAQEEKNLSLFFDEVKNAEQIADLKKELDVMKQ